MTEHIVPRRPCVRWVACLVLVLIAPCAAAAQAADVASEADSEPVARDAYDVATPAGAVRTFIDAARDGDYATAADRLDLAGVEDPDGQRLARRLKAVLDRVLWVDYEQISGAPEGDLDDGLAADLERMTGADDIAFYLRRVQVEERDEPVWKFSAGTVERIPQLFERYGNGPLGEVLPPFMFEYRFLEIQLWQWIGLFLLSIAAYAVAWIVVRVVAAVVTPLVDRTTSDIDDHLVVRLVAPVRLVVAVAILVVVARGALRLAVPAQDYLSHFGRALTLLAIAWIAWRVIDVVTIVFRRRLECQGRRSAVAVLPMARRVVKAFLVALAAVGVLQNLGFEVTGLIAGLGVGGLAIALAAQKSIENLFGGVTILADQPVRVGDFCRFGDGQTGTVEEIGLRSTRIRTLDRTLVTLPNSSFSELYLENYAERDRIRLTTTIGVRYETTPDQMRWILAELRKVLLRHPRTTNDPARVRFKGFGASSLDIDIFTYVDTTDFAEFLAIREDVFLRIMDVVERSGSGFAFPSQTLYLGRDGGLDGERSRSAEAEVAAWRREGRLPFPEFSQESLAELDGRDAYPPEGSEVPRSTQPSGGGEAAD